MSGEEFFSRYGAAQISGFWMTYQKKKKKAPLIRVTDNSNCHTQTGYTVAEEESILVSEEA